MGENAPLVFKVYMTVLSSFTYFFLRYHLKDVIVGKIYFLLVRIKIKHMELAIIKRETTGTGEQLLRTNICDCHISTSVVESKQCKKVPW